MSTSYSVFLLLFIVSVAFVKSSRLVYHTENSQPDELDMLELYLAEPPAMVKRGGQSPKGASHLWFGPRLGKRESSVTREKREIDDDPVFKLMPDGTWTVVALKGGKRRSVNFSPRLGRESTDELLESYIDAYNMYGRTPPRSGPQPTGVTNNNFTPRLGRLAPLEPHQAILP